MPTFLLGQQETATAATSTATTIIDWTRIDEFANLTLVSINVGGGTGDTCLFEMDESNDASTVSATQSSIGGVHSATEGNATALTSTYKYGRIQSAAASSDTTCKAWITATNYQGGLCTLTDVRNRVGIETAETTDDDSIRDIIRGVSGQFDMHCNRSLLLNSSDVTELYDGSRKRIKTDRYPIVSITSLKESVDYDFTNATALTADTDYHSNDEEGTLYKMGGSFVGKDESVQLIYKGGYVGPNGTASGGETALPDDIREAAILQAVFTYQRRGDVGLTSVSADGVSISKFSSMALLPIVKQTLNKYKRRVF